ncbi:MAG: ATP-binding protein, partial [Woeseia sp.]
LPEAAFQTFTDYVWHPVVMSFGGYLYLLLYVEAWRRSNAALHLLAMSGSVMVLFGAHDVLVSSGAAPWGFGYLLPYSAASSLVVFSALLVNDFARDQIKLENITRDLDRRVQAAPREIERNHVALRAFEQERVLTVERERVARDIHDGVGGQLVALLSRIKSGRQTVAATETAVSHAMHDLRLVIESLDVADGDLVTALASWRHGLERRFVGSGLRIVWQPTDIPRLTNVGPSDILNVLRLLDESATNALRHAKASTITIRYGIDDGEFFISLSDDGIGGARVSADGNGLINMRQRATALNAQLNVESTEKGTTIRLQFRPRPAATPVSL